MAVTVESRARRSYAPRLPTDERRRQLLDAALAVADRDGLWAVSMEAVAREADVTKPVVYGLFANADELLAALVEREQGRAYRRILDALPPDEKIDDPVEVAELGLLAIFQSARENAATWKLLLAYDQLPDDARRTTLDVRDQLIATVTGLVELANESRESGPIDPELTGNLLVGGGEMGVRLILREPDRFSDERMAGFVRELVRSVWNG